jgi:hypothetical protein
VRTEIARTRCGLAENGRGGDRDRGAIRAFLAQLSTQRAPERQASGSSAVYQEGSGEAFESAGCYVEHGQCSSQRLLLQVLSRQRSVCSLLCGSSCIVLASQLSTKCRHGHVRQHCSSVILVASVEHLLVKHPLCIVCSSCSCCNVFKLLMRLSRRTHPLHARMHVVKDVTGPL